MTTSDLIPLLPLLVLTAAAIGLLLLIACRRNHAAAAALCVLGLALAFVAVPTAAARRAPVDVTLLIAVDGYTVFFQGLIVLAALGVALLSYGYLARREELPREEYYVLLLTATLGAATIVASRHFAAFFLGLEMLSLSLVALIAYPASLDRPVEAGLKYLILAGLSSAFLLFGIALVYFVAGGLSLDAIAIGGAAQHPSHGIASQLYALSGLALILVGIGFKLSIVPFHLWAPDVYEGAPAPIAAFIAVVSKTAVLALLLRYYLAAQAFGAAPPLAILSAAAILSMLFGNLLALLQQNVKRILAYSSIAHLGYALVAFLAGGPLAIEAVSVYLVAYAISTLGAFGIVGVLSSGRAHRDVDELDEYRGLFRHRPALATVFTLMLLSLAGIPITVGFIAKFYAVASGIGASLAAPLAALVAGSIIGLYYYLRIIVAMIQPAPQIAADAQPEHSPLLPARALPALVLTVSVILLIGLGIYPAPLVALVRATAGTLAEGEPSLLAARGSIDSRPAGRDTAFSSPRPGSTSMTIKSDSVVSIHYTLKDDGGEVIDSSDGSDPLTYLHGHGQLIPGLERQLEGHDLGDKLNVKVPAADGYGEYDNALVQQVPRRALKGIANVKVGMQLRAQTDHGARTVTVTRVAGDMVTLDGNHPLAGKNLNFDVAVAAVRDATAEELAHGHVHGPGGHDH